MQEESISLQPQKSKDNQQAEKKQRHLKKKFKRRRPINFGRLALGLFLVIAGIYFFAETTGFLPTGFQLDVNLAQLWPLLIVFAGLSLLSSRSRIAALVGGLLTLVVILAIGYLLVSKSERIEKYSQPVETTPFQVNSLDDTLKRNEINITANGTSLDVSGSSGALAQGKLVSNVSDLQTNTLLRDDVQITTISTKGNFEKFPTKYENRLDIQLDKSKHLSLNVQCKASKSNLDLRNFDLTDLTVKADVSDLSIKFPKGTLPVALDTRTSNVSLMFPKGTGVRITSSSELSRADFTGMAEINQDETYKSIFETQDYEQSETKINIEIISTLSNYEVFWLD